MLNKSTIDVGVNISEMFVDHGIAVAGKPSTLMGQLGSAIGNRLYQCSSIKPTLDSVKMDIEYAAAGVDRPLAGGNGYDPSEHDSYMDNYIEELSVLVSGHLDFSRNVVNKEVVKLSTVVTDRIESYKHREAEEFFNLSYYKLPSVLNIDILATEIPSYSEDTKSIRSGVDSINLNGLVGEDTFARFLLTGVEEEDTIITGWFNSLGVFGVTCITDPVAVFGMDLPTLINYHLANYLFYRKLATDSTPVKSEGTVVVTRKASTNRDYHGASLASAIGVYKASIRTGKLLASNDIVFSYFSERQIDLVVYEESFAALAEAGHGVESIFGYIASTGASSSVTVAELTGAGVDYVDRWKKTRGLYMIHLNKKRIDIFKHILRSEFEMTINVTEPGTEAEKEFYSKDSNYAKETLRIGNEYIDEITVETMDDLDTIALVLTAKVRFRFSNAYLLLAKMKELLNSDAKLEPMEAALYSIVSYLTSYCLSQVDVSKVR